MKQQKCYENYPFWIVFISNTLQIAIYLIGAWIMYLLGTALLVVYLLFIAFLEIKLLKTHCIDCCYYGKACAFGKGKLCSIFFKKGNQKNFCKKQMTFKDMIPDLLVSAIPILVGIIFLIINFNWILLVAVVLLVLLTSFGNGFVRGSLACKYCKQRKLGCPAEKLFEKKK